MLGYIYVHMFTGVCVREREIERELMLVQSVCCSVLQCVAVCCSVLQRVAVC